MNSFPPSSAILPPTPSITDCFVVPLSVYTQSMLPRARSSAKISPCQVATYTTPALTRGALVIRSLMSNDHTVCPVVILSAHRLLPEPRPTYTVSPATAGTQVVGQPTAPR